VFWFSLVGRVARGKHVRARERKEWKREKEWESQWYY